MDNTIVALMDGVSKKLGRRPVLRRVDLEVRRGEVHVLAGPNGAGKTTSIRVLLGLLGRDSGRVMVLGAEPGRPGWREAAARVGYLPEDAGVYERLTGWENLLYYARLYADGEEDAVEMARYGAELSGLGEAIHRRAGEYSRGMRRRLLVARALMHRPDLAVLDEPTSGLDVFSSLKVRETVRAMASHGTAFLVTTHNLLEAERLADRVTFIVGGRTIFTGPPGRALNEFSSESLEEAFVEAVRRAGQG